MKVKATRGVHIGHTSCDHCGSSDAVAVYKDDTNNTYNGFCFSSECGTYNDFGEAKPHMTDGKSSNVNKHDLTAITSLPCEAIADRRVSSGVAKKYGVKTKKVGDSVTARYYPVKKKGTTTGYKVRYFPKRFTQVGDCTGDKEMFGQSVFEKGGKMLIITEGEEDAMAAYMMTAVKSRVKRGYASISLTDGMGAQADKCIDNNLAYINSFEQVVFAVDQEDKALEWAKSTCAKLDAGKGKVATFSEKDCSDMWMAGKQDEFWNSMWGAVTPGDDHVVDGFDKAWSAWQDRLNYEVVPWPSGWKMDNVGSGLYSPALISMTAGTGVGKSTVLKHLQYHLFKMTNKPIGVISLEEPLSLCEGVLMGLHMNKRITVPGVESTIEEQKEACKDLFGEGRFIFYDNMSVRTTEDFFNKIRFMANSKGCQFIFVDHLTALLNKVSPDVNKNTHTEILLNRLNEISLELNVGIILVSHTRGLPSSSTSTYEEGLVPTEDSMFGSSSIKQYSSCTIAVSRDKTETDSPVHIHVLKDRLSGQTGKSRPLKFDLDTGWLI